MASLNEVLTIPRPYVSIDWFRVSPSVDGSVLERIMLEQFGARRFRKLDSEWAWEWEERVAISPSSADWLGLIGLLEARSRSLVVSFSNELHSCVFVACALESLLPVWEYTLSRSILKVTARQVTRATFPVKAGTVLELDSDQTAVFKLNAVSLLNRESGSVRLLPMEQLVKLSYVTLESLPEEEVIIEKDPKDDKFLHAAVEAHADYIVSGDHHLLDLKEYEGINIVTPNMFLSILKKQVKSE